MSLEGITQFISTIKFIYFLGHNFNSKLISNNTPPSFVDIAHKLKFIRFVIRFLINLYSYLVFISLPSCISYYIQICFFLKLQLHLLLSNKWRFIGVAICAQYIFYCKKKAKFDVFCNYYIIVNHTKYQRVFIWCGHRNIK